MGVLSEGDVDVSDDDNVAAPLLQALSKAVHIARQYPSQLELTVFLLLIFVRAPMQFGDKHPPLLSKLTASSHPPLKFR
jgi:hypothetical protein